MVGYGTWLVSVALAFVVVGVCVGVSAVVMEFADGSGSSDQASG